MHLVVVCLACQQSGAVQLVKALPCFPIVLHPCLSNTAWYAATAVLQLVHEPPLLAASLDCLCTPLQECRTLTSV